MVSPDKSRCIPKCVGNTLRQTKNGSCSRQNDTRTKCIVYICGPK